MKALLLPLAALAFAPALSAQTGYTFDIDVTTSDFFFSGDSSLGRIVGRPGDFAMDGTIDMDLTAAGTGFSTGAFTGGVVFTVPSRIKAEIPNVFSFLPPLATIYVDDAAYTPTSASFAIDAAGNFSTDLVMTPIAGTVTVIPITGGTEVSNLADYGPSDPTPVQGSVTAGGGLVLLNMPVDLSFTSDDGQGNWVRIDLDGVLNASAPEARDMTLSTPGPVVAGQNATFDVADGQPNTATFLAYGLALGSTPVPPLGITLDLDGAQQLGSAVVADGQGAASWTLPVPPAAAGLTVYLQACQNGQTSNVLDVLVQ